MVLDAVVRVSYQRQLSMPVLNISFR
jgi:hypothetical protein